MIETSRQRFKQILVCSSSGSVLIIVLVFLMILTIATTTAMRTRIVEMRMAANEETRITTLELTQSIVEQVVGNPDNFNLASGVGFKNCTANVINCSENSITVDAALAHSADNNAVEVIVERLEPALSPAPRALMVSGNAFNVARFEVSVNFKVGPMSDGSIEIAQGVLVVVPRRVQTN